MSNGYVMYKFVRRNGKKFGPYKHHRTYRADGTYENVYLGRVSMKEYKAWKRQH